MQEDLSVVLASNRGPVSFIRTEQGLTTKGAAGGASPALDAVARRLGSRASWIAAAISDADREAVSSGEAHRVAEEMGYDLRLLSFDPEVYSGYYNDISNRMLWFANHCLWDEIGIRGEDLAPSAWDLAYEPVNHAFAEAAADHLQRGALVLFQDYHLSTAPRHLRRLRPDAPISHFTHSSFCGPEGFEPLPAEIMRGVITGMLGADLVGLHVSPWVDGFLRCCERIGARVDRPGGVVEYEGRRTWVRAYPIPVDTRDLKERAHAEHASDWARRFRAWAGDGVLIVRGDRAEPSKNIVRGFEAFGALLDARTDVEGRVRFAACIYPSRQGLEEYRSYVERIMAAAERVNERHPGVIELYMNDDFDRTLGAYRVYDVLLVNPIMDGMNLVAKEGAVLNERDGVLVLSKGAGSHAELGDGALVVEDPLDVRETAMALGHAIDMSADERATRAASLREKASASRPTDWIEDQINDLIEVRDGREPLTPPSSFGDEGP